MANIRLRPRCFTDESPEAAATKSDVALHPFRLRAASGAGLTDNPPESEPNPLIGVRLRSTGINVTDPLKSPNNGAGPTTSSVGSPSDAGGEAKNDKNESRNSLSKLKPPPLAPKPRPWSIVGSDKKAGEVSPLYPASQTYLDRHYLYRATIIIFLYWCLISIVS